MTHFHNKKLGVEFDTPDTLTVRQQLEFMSIRDGDYSESGKHERAWLASLPLIRNWKCSWLADPLLINIDSPAADGRYLILILWVGGSVFQFVAGLDSLPKVLSGGSSPSPASGEMPPPN